MKASLGACIFFFATRAHASSLTFQPPSRDFGYYPGDLLQTRASVTMNPGEHLDSNALPAPGPLTGFIELRSITLQQDGNLAVISSTYQNFLATDHVLAGEIPGYTLRLAGPTSIRNILVPAWTFHVSPLRAAEPTSEMLPELRPDAPLPNQPETPILLQAAASAAAATILAAALALRQGRLTLSFARPSIFAAATQKLQRRQIKTANPATAFLILHRAFDEAAGRRLFAADIRNFLAQHPHFAPLAPRIAAFFAASHTRFFARTAPAALPEHPATHAEILALARALRGAERRA